MTARPPCLLRADGVTVDYAERRAIEDLSVGLEQGVVTALVGSNCSGKSTLLKALARLLALSLERPEKELKGFVKLALEPGETKTAEFTLDMRAFAYFDESENAWVAEEGEFEVLVGAASDDVRARARFALSGTWRESMG